MSAPDPDAALAAALAELRRRLDLPDDLHAALAATLAWAVALDDRARGA
jgi:hypothetical protein